MLKHIRNIRSANMNRTKRIYLSVTPEEERRINENYARYLLRDDEQKTKNQWIVGRLTEVTE